MNTERQIYKLLLLGTLILASACTQTESNLSGQQPPPPFNNGCIGAFCPQGGGVQPTPTPPGTTTPPTSGAINPSVPTPVPVAAGDTETMTVVSVSTLADYVGSPLNNPSPIQINIQLHPVGSNPQVFLGQMSIRFNDDQGGGRVVLHSPTFTNGSDSGHGNNVHVLTTESSTGTPTYRIFFEDRAGALILTLQKKPGAGDVGNFLSGRVYYRNFNTTAPNPLFDTYYQVTPWCDAYTDANCVWYAGNYYYQFPQNQYAFCWAGDGNGPTIGPYDCRNFNVQPDTGGDKAFTLLGTIDNVDQNKALGI